MEVQADRQRRGLEPLPEHRKQATFGEALDAWKSEVGSWLRTLLHRIFELALRRGLFTGLTPAKSVPRFKKPKKLPQYLKAGEVPLMLAALERRWRPLFATAVYSGMRKGELLALRKSDVDLTAGTVVVARSHASDTTKGGH